MTRRIELLATAARLFRKNGYKGTSIKDIARELGLLKGSLYNHMDSKEQLLYDVVVMGVRCFRGALEEVAQAPWSSSQKIHEAVLRHLHPFETSPNEVIVFLNERENLSEDLRRQLQEEIDAYDGLLMQIIKEGIAKGELCPDLDPRITVLGIIGMCNSIQRWHRPDGRLSIAEIAELFASIVVNGISKKTSGIEDHGPKIADPATTCPTDLVKQPL